MGWLSSSTSECLYHVIPLIWSNLPQSWQPFLFGPEYTVSSPTTAKNHQSSTSHHSSWNSSWTSITGLISPRSGDYGYIVIAVSFEHLHRNFKNALFAFLLVRNIGAERRNLDKDSFNFFQKIRFERVFIH